MKEEWRKVVRYEEEYLVSNHGRVQTQEREIIRKNGLPHFVRSRIRKLKPTKFGHLSVGLQKQGLGLKTHLVHHLVLEAFVGPCPPEMECRHLDGNPANNYRTNLKWGSHERNQRDRNRHGTVNDHHGERNPRVKLTIPKVRKIRRLHATGKYTLSEIGSQFGIAFCTVWSIVHRKSWINVA